VLRGRHPEAPVLLLLAQEESDPSAQDMVGKKVGISHGIILLRAVGEEQDSRKT
jgi:hypothetical protein